MITMTRAGGLLCLLLASVSLCWANVRLPTVLANHMVLQQQMPVPIWGTAAPNEAVTVKFRTQEKTTTADAAGKWRVTLDPLEAGGPDTLTVTGRKTITLTDVLVGEVWVGSGQSNMAKPAADFTKNDENLAKLVAGAPYPRLRMCSVNGGWREATGPMCNGYSALLFGFGALLQQKLNVPVGLLVGAGGGTPSGFWLSEDAYRSDAACKAAAADYLKTHPYDEAQEDARYQEAVTQYNTAKAEWDKLPAEEQKKAKHPPFAPRHSVKPGECDDKIGHLYDKMIRPYIPFAIRGVLWDQGEAGTRIVGVDQYTLMGALIRGWRAAWGQDIPFVYVEKPSGDGCAYDPANPVTNKAEKFSGLPKVVPDDGDYRGNHIRIMTYPRTAMAITSDLGAGTHPTNKFGYADRACRVALALVYQQPVEYYGPLFAAQTVEGNKIRLTYTHLGQGLAMPAGQEKLQGFAIAGEDKQFVWADAAIDGATVVVSSPTVAKPCYVRYAWANHIAWANLFNKDGLPAIPFRTDN